ncbi:MAG: FAD-dependent oxidoreductase [Verrucomicrobiae bacterium]|nr:FAD-dependent oxidoreductase [Verrucomicrobiae bacterium]MCP5546867.1 FAD-dependent oxidoreductase [Akkermansiaceae bacterium]
MKPFPLRRTAAFLAIALCGATVPATAARRADVIVYGATPGGVCAAVAAAREGASVILLEPTAHIGGMNTGGLSFSDSDQTVRNTLGGLFDEWHGRIEKDYLDRDIQLPYRVSEKNHAPWTYEPHVASRVTRRMLDDAGVEVLPGHDLRSVSKESGRITELVTGNGDFSGKVFIDASYEGDLMAASGVRWTIGREGRNAHGESHAGRQYPKRRMEISGLDENGKPLPFVTSDKAGPDDAGDSHVMTYSFRLCLTDDPANRVPMPEPADYDPARFEVMRRYVKASGGAIGFSLLGPLPGGRKFDGNNAIGFDFSIGLIGAGDAWCEADAAGRAAILEAHKQYTLEFHHFLTTDPAVPESIRSEYARFGLCRDEFSETGHFPPALYVREGRRMKGMYVLTEKDILETPEKPDSIAVSSFPIDSHDCRRVALTGGGVINEGTIYPVRKKHPREGFPYQVPFRSILPLPSECANLLVPVALSSSHVAFSSLRVEPTWMVLGQSAGIAAAMAADAGTAVQDLSYPVLRDRLLSRGQVLDLPAPAPHDSAPD